MVRDDEDRQFPGAIGEGGLEAYGRTDGLQRGTQARLKEEGVEGPLEGAVGVDEAEQPGPLGPPAAAKVDQMNLHDNEIRLIMRALEESDGNRTEAAKRLGISRRTLHRRLRELNLPDPHG